MKSAEITNIYIHSRVRYDLYHMSLDRTNMDNIDRPNFDLLKRFFDSSSDEEKKYKIKSFIEATRANRDVRVWYKQCIPRKLCTLALTLKGYLGIWYKVHQRKKHTIAGASTLYLSMYLCNYTFIVCTNLYALEKKH